MVHAGVAGVAEQTLPFPRVLRVPRVMIFRVNPHCTELRRTGC